MARPQKRTVDYFPHYATSGKTLLILQNEYGNDGYAFWFKLLSLLCKTDGQVYDYNNYASWRLLLAETQVSEDIADKILQILADIDAIDKDLHSHKVIWVQNLVDNLEDVYSRRTNGSTPRKPVIVDNNVLLEGVTVSNNTVNVSNKPQTKLNYTKQDKTRVDNTTNKKQVKHKYGQFKNVLLADDEKQKLIDRFGEDGFSNKVEGLSVGIESKGYKYKSHYAAILSWERKDNKELGKNAGVNRINTDDPDKYVKGKYGHMVRR